MNKDAAKGNSAKDVVPSNAASGFQWRGQKQQGLREYIEMTFIYVYTTRIYKLMLQGILLCEIRITPLCRTRS